MAVNLRTHGTYAADVVRCVSPPPSDEVVSAAGAMLAVLHYMRN